MILGNKSTNFFVLIFQSIIDVSEQVELYKQQNTVVDINYIPENYNDFSLLGENPKDLNSVLES
ncbi:MAG: hypothetical protein LN588_00030 [Rickettsia endosymbiont of Bryobia graminum]|nr:hypothetical protein [Rickettsia endosymbiont of Bryobia graminum]